MLTKTFIKEVFGEQIKQMTMGKDGQTPFPYLGFSIICQCIEVLGARFDEYDWEERKLSELRFRLAVTKLFPDKYQVYNRAKKKIDLYRNHRCPMIHQFTPGRSISLSERKHERASNTSGNHLSIQNNKLFLIYEDFLDDFIQASKKIVQMIDSGELTTQKRLVIIFLYQVTLNKYDRNHLHFYQ